jgi:glutathione reductase (NADPH)
MATHYDMLVLGAGSGGLGCAKRAAMRGRKVAVIEKDRLGGTCVNVGCVPKKLMYEAANFLEDVKHCYSFGVEIPDHKFYWQRLKEKVDNHIRIVNGRYVEGLANSGVEVINGYGTFVDAHTV